MPSTFFGLTIGKSGTYAAQAAITTTAHNIANANTKGYSRQKISQSASKPISVSSSYGMVGTGVDVNSIYRERNIYLDEKYRRNNNLYGNYVTKEYYMTSIENYFSEVKSDGTTATFDDFYLALEDLARDVGNPTNRTAAAEAAKSFTEYVNYLAKGMTELQDEANFEIKTTVDQINTLATEIATLNKQINVIEINGGFANDLRDSRDLLLDELSSLANITVTEDNVGGEETGVTKCIVKLDGKILVDNYDSNQLVVTSKKGSDNQCDIEGLYKISWSDGQEFAMNSNTLGGKLQALIEFRDGNNQENFTGNAYGNAADPTSITVKNANINNINLLNIPSGDGTIIIDNQEYTYQEFTMTLQADGSYEYTFMGLKNYLGADASLADVNGADIRIGERIDYKGIPYYQAQLNEYVRTYSAAFNAIHNTGKDLYGNEGKDFFNALMESTGYNYDFDEILTVGKTYYSIPQASSVTADGLVNGSYYNMTALNISIAMSITSDPGTIACSSNKTSDDGNVIEDGIEEKKVLNQLLDLKDDNTMFKQGTPSGFLQSFTATIGVDGKQAAVFASSQKNILASVDMQRMSISSVDKDEEAMNLVQYKEIYNLSCKVIQIMQELYDKLINGTAV